nr:CPBP family intramembrane glutamic endopeptidase [Anaerofilum sp. An201]
MLCMAGALCCTAGQMIAARLAAVPAGLFPALQPLFTVLAALAGYLPAIWLLDRAAPAKGWGRAPVRRLPCLLAALLGAAALGSLLSLLLPGERAAPLPPEGAMIPAGLLAKCLLPAVCEEWIFRRRMLPLLAEAGASGAVAGTAVLFALAHPDPRQAVTALFAGLVLGAAAWKYGAGCSAVLHLCNNLLAFGQLWNPGLGKAALAAGMLLGWPVLVVWLVKHRPRVSARLAGALCHPLAAGGFALYLARFIWNITGGNA